MKQWMHTRPIRTLGVLFALSLVLTACDPQDVLQLFDGHAVRQAAPADADSRHADSEHRDGKRADRQDADSKKEKRSDARRHRTHGDRATAAHERHSEKRDTAPTERRRRRADHDSDKPKNGAHRGDAGSRNGGGGGNGDARTRKAAKPGAGSGGGSGSLSDVERAIFDRLNSTRRSAGLRALTQSAAISEGARSWSCQMAKTGNFDHANLRSAGVSGENIAWGQSGAAAVHDAWMQSSGHRANRMKSSWNEYGVGVCKDGNGRPYYTERFR